MNYLAEQDATVTLTNGSDTTTHKLYTPEGFDLVSNLWIKAAVNQNLNHEAHWYDHQIIQFPTDILVMHELLWAVKPDLVIECGIGAGGSLLMFAEVLQTIGANGRAIGIDNNLSGEVRASLLKNQLGKRLALVEGPSMHEQTLDYVREQASKAQSVMVFLDSDHDANYVGQELEAYAPLVTSGSYLVCQDGAQGWIWEVPARGNQAWKDNHPLIAIEAFLAKHPEFTVDERLTRYGITSSPMGYMKRA